MGKLEHVTQLLASSPGLFYGESWKFTMLSLHFKMVVGSWEIQVLHITMCKSYAQLISDLHFFALYKFIEIVWEMKFGARNSISQPNNKEA